MSASGRGEGTFLGHPKGLYVLFVTEMWERFSYYGMRALLMLYMINYFKWTQEGASSVYKWYTALVYLTPLLGGFLADRYLGNKWAIIIGATLMAIGHFCMAFEAAPVFYAALVFLIMGNGFFKPNMSTQVGRLYPANDDRRDGAYTIFYMGINLGAFLAPLACGYLAADDRVWNIFGMEIVGYHAGFGLAGVGMVLGLVVYLVGLPWIKEIPHEVRAAAPQTAPRANHYMSEDQAATTPSVIPGLARIGPQLLYVLGCLCVASAAAMYFLNDALPEAIQGVAKPDNLLALALGGGFANLMGGWILSQVQMAMRDRVLAILVMAMLVIFFWAAFEQAGNAMNVYADKVTDRYVTEPAPPPPLFSTPSAERAADQPGAPVGQQMLKAFNPMPTAWFQSINPLAIFILAPIFAWMWTTLPRRGINLSIPTKVAIGVFLQGVAFALMIWAVGFENRPTAAPLASLPERVEMVDGRVMFLDAPDVHVDPEKHYDAARRQVVHGGRLSFDPSGELRSMGVLSDTDRDRMLRATAPPSFIRAVQELSVKAADAAREAGRGGSFEVSVTLDPVPPGFDIRYAGMATDKLRFDAQTGTLTTTVTLPDKDYKQVLVCGADPAFRDALNHIYVASAQFKLGVAWLFWFYILCTLGELCLSPVGLSMVSKLAPARFATMLMGMWLLTSFFGNFLAGFAGENWSAYHPYHYFGVITAVMLAASLVAFLLVRKVTAMMHGVR